MVVSSFNLFFLLGFDSFKFFSNRISCFVDLSLKLFFINLVLNGLFPIIAAKSS